MIFINYLTYLRRSPGRVSKNTYETKLVTFILKRYCQKKIIRNQEPRKHTKKKTTHVIRISFEAGVLLAGEKKKLN